MTQETHIFQELQKYQRLIHLFFLTKFGQSQPLLCLLLNLSDTGYWEFPIVTIGALSKTIIVILFAIKKHICDGTVRPYLANFCQSGQILKALGMCRV